MTAEEIRRALEPWKVSHQRRAWKPRVTPGEGAPAGSRYGGAAWLPDGVAPRCKSCEEPMPLLLQLNLFDTPGELGAGLLQVFYCADPDCEQECDGWSPFSAMHLVRIVASDDGALDAARESNHPAQSIVAWDDLVDEPHPEDQHDLGLEIQYDFQAKTIAVRCAAVNLDSPPVPLSELEVEQIANAASGDKLLGWPYWIQGAEYPACPKCSAPMRVLFQLDSEEHLPIMWGDSGIAHVSQCPAHPEVLTMGWACC
jgi:uncharacterized protein YwqG